MEVGRHMEMRQKKREWPSDTQRSGVRGGGTWEGDKGKEVEERRNHDGSLT